MLFHEALHLVFSTFSRQVLQQGRLTAYLADCGVFDTFDDSRTICLAIDHHYGARLYSCLSHSPYKQQFDAMVAEAKQLHPAINPQQVEYVFQSIRFAWGKIKSVRPPKTLSPFPIAKCPTARRASNRASARPIAKRPVAKRPIARRASNRASARPIAQHPSSPPFRAGAGGRPTPAQRQKRNARVVLYLFALVFTFCACILFNTHHGDVGAFCLLAAGICIYAIYKYLK